MLLLFLNVLCGHTMLTLNSSKKFHLRSFNSFVVLLFGNAIVAPV
jgi:hypothetical protein